MHRTSALRTMLLLAAAPLLLGSIGVRGNFEERLLAAHNRERAALAVPPLQWNEELAQGAQEWADELSRSGRFEHSPDVPGEEPEGENIWGGTPYYYSPERMVRLWASEKRYFRPGTFPYTSRTGRVEDVSHYTQLVWRDSTDVGCAASVIGDEEILVCRYSSPGNVLGEQVL